MAFNGRATAITSSSTSGSRVSLVRLVRQQAALLVSLLLAVVAASGTGAQKDQIDYCHSELFTAECSADDEILVVRNASYGRMRGTSRCLQSDPTSYIGCRANVIRQADRICSGRRSCRIPVPNPSFELVQPCPKATRSYLEIIVECQKVMTVSQSVQCGPDWPVAVRGSPTEAGYLSSFVAIQRGFGSPNCPWRIEAEPGRRINLTLIDFATPTATDLPVQGSSPGTAIISGPGIDHVKSSSSAVVSPSGGATVSRVCYQYATISERPGLVGSTMTTRTFHVCGGDRRERHVSVSASNVVDVQFSRRNVETDRDFYFLFQYRAVGCAEPQAPLHGWMMRERGGQAITVGCNATQRSWRLVCDDTRWTWTGGFVLGTDRCPKTYVRTDRVATMWTALNIPFKITLGVLIGFTATGIIVVLLCVLICAEWIKTRRPARSRSKSRLLLDRRDEQPTRSTSAGPNGRNQQMSSAVTACGPAGGRQGNSTTTAADVGRYQHGQDTNKRGAVNNRGGGAANGPNHVLVDLDAASSVDSPLPSPPLPPMPTLSAEGSSGNPETPSSSSAVVTNGDDISTYVREMWPMAPPPAPMMMAGGGSTMTSFPLPPPPLLPPESMMSPELSDASHHRKKRTQSTGAGAGSMIGRQSMMTSSTTMVTTGPALPPRPTSAYVGGTTSTSGDYVLLASNASGTRTWNPRAGNGIRPETSGVVVQHTKLVAGSGNRDNIGSRAHKDYDISDYDSTKIRETPLYVRREQLVNSSTIGPGVASGAASGLSHGRRSVGGAGASANWNGDRQHMNHQRYFEMIPNGGDSIDYDDEEDDDDDEVDGNDEVNGRYDSIAAVTARSRSKSLPRNVAARPTNMAASLTSSTNRYH